MITAMLDWAAPRGIGFSHVVSLGDMADVDFGDMLDWLATEQHTSAILLYAEGITHGRKFMSAARAAARLKPVLVLKAGRSLDGARAAASHTGMLAGSDRVYDAAFRRAGMLRVDTMAELFDAVETLALTGEQNGDRLAILTNGGGAGVLADRRAGARRAGGSPSCRPRRSRGSTGCCRQPGAVATRSTSSATPRERAMLPRSKRLFADDGVDAVLALNCPTALAAPEEAARAVIDALASLPAATRRGRNLFTAWLGEHSAAAARTLFNAARVPTYDTPEEAVTALLHRVRYQRNQALLMETPPARPESDTRRSRAGRRRDRRRARERPILARSGGGRDRARRVPHPAPGLASRRRSRRSRRRGRRRSAFRLR